MSLQKGHEPKLGCENTLSAKHFEGCNFNHIIMTVKSHSMSSMMRKPGKVTLPTAHYSHQKTSQSKISNRKYAKRPTEISLTTWAEMISGQARESWKPSTGMVFAGFISASSIIIVWVTSLALAPLQSQLAVDQHTSKSINSLNHQTLNGGTFLQFGNLLLACSKRWFGRITSRHLFQSKHFRGIFNTSRSFSQKAAFLLQANSFAIQLLQKVYMNNLAVAVALLRLVDLSSDILCLERACSQSVHLEYPWLNNQMLKPSTILPYKPVGSATSHQIFTPFVSVVSLRLSQILDPNMASHAAPVPWSEKRLGNSVPNDVLLLKRRLLGDHIEGS